MADPFLASNEFPGDGTTTLYNISFKGNRPDAGSGVVPYLNASDVKAQVVTPATNMAAEIVVDVPVVYVGPNQFRVTPATPVGKITRIYRATQDEYALVDYQSLQNVGEADLDLSNRQVVFIVQEAHDLAVRSKITADSTAELAGSAVTLAETAIDTANSTIAIANAASVSAGAAVATANAASATIATANSNANAAVATANAIADTANSALDASATALATANTANATASGISAVANAAAADASSAVTVATAANTAANSATSTANAVDAKATTALSNSASALTAANTANTALAGKAASGVNSDITQLTALSTAITIAQGGTGSTTAAASRTALALDDGWVTQPIGALIALQSNLTGVTAPPTNQNYRYVKLTASDSYNTGILTSETVSGSAPLVVATAVVNLAGSPLNGLTISLINTERRVLRAGSAGTLEQDAIQNITGSASSYYRASGAGTSGAFTSGTYSTTPGKPGVVGGDPGDSATISFNASLSVRTDTETRVKSIGVTYYMRIK